ncbi:hypothetical protein KXD40_008697 [Peronospora effusa]|uniref:Guanylate cyclase domain-containing protein n=1 Tax=Peronospora effusa TaxID=542832 RepID=A0A3M6VNQ7_9STRA|nr:hypothetical protein DD238_005281 [Peronospora effusa]RQM09144.1 hypothetical protein DD237_005382 [Peronospora effusa]UIZ21935.1 hypothetical protein KXD40_008697 [Peronospora effusa]CAI5705170.1 unnamed protein product [Peronospora effusa]
MLAAYHMRQLGGDLFRSTVRFVIAMFLFCSTLHAFATGVLYAYLAHAINGVVVHIHDTKSKSHLTQSEIILGQLLHIDNESDGGEAAYITKLTQNDVPLSTALEALLLVEDLFFILSAYWIFLLSRELFKLAMRTLDRGEQSEKATILKYVSRGWLIVGLFVGTRVVIVIVQHGYNRTYKYFSFMELGGLLFSIFYTTGALVVLRFSGRKHEHIHGVVMASPLYRRLKLLMIVCAIFTLPYCFLQVGLLCMPQDQVDAIPDFLVGIVTMLYYLFGAAQALVMGGSQQCCIRMLSPIISTQVRNSPEWANLRANRRLDSYAIYETTAPPDKPVFVNTDIEGSSALWAQKAPESILDTAQDLHDDLLRSLLPKYNGYEITTAGDAFQLAFHRIPDAVNYCLEVQLELLQVRWPSKLEGLVPSVKTEVALGLKPQLLFRGIRVRMGIHDTNVSEEGNLIMQTHRVTGKALYIGASEYIGREIGDVGFGGQIIISRRVAAWLQTNDNASRITTPIRLDYYGMQPIHQLDIDIELYEITPKVLKMRRKIFRRRMASNISDESAFGTDTDDPPLEDCCFDVEYTCQRTPTSRFREKMPTVIWQTIGDR